MVLIMMRKQTFALLLCACACTWKLSIEQSTGLINYYACYTSLTAYFTFSCPNPTQYISVQYALIGFSTQYSIQTTPAICPWTSNTSATCDTIGYPQCTSTSPCTPPCNCTAVTSIPANNCNGKNSCTFGQSFLVVPSGTALCLLSRDANFVSVNYTCTYPSTLTTSQTMTSTTTTTKPTSTSSAVLSITSTSTGSVTFLPSSQSSSSMTTSTSSALSSPTIPTSTSFSITISNANTVQTSSQTTSTTANALPPGAIVGIVVGAVVFVAIVVVIAAIVLCCHRKKQNLKGQAVSHNKIANGKDSTAVGYDAAADVVGWIEHEKAAPATSSGGNVRNGSVKMPTAPVDNDTVGLTPGSITDPKGKQGEKTSTDRSSTANYAEVVPKKKKSTPAVSSAAANRKSATYGNAETSGNGGIVGSSVVSLHPSSQNRQSAQTSTSVNGDRADTDVHMYANSVVPVAVQPLSVSNGDAGNNSKYVSVVHSPSNIESSNNLTLVDSELYSNTSGAGQQQGQRQGATEAGSSAMNLTLIENSLYSDAI